VSALLLCLALAVLVLVLGGWLLATGLRAGDRPGDTLISAIGADAFQGVRFTASNPGRQAVLIGATVSRRTLRLMVEGGAFTRVPRRTDRDDLLAGRHTVVCAVGPGETQTVRVPLAEQTVEGPRAAGCRPAVAPGRWAQLVLAIGEPDRLRVVHRAVRLPANAGRSRPEARRATMRSSA